MNCDTAKATLEPYLDGELDRAAVDELEAHLDSCAACRAELASLEELKRAVRALPRRAAPADLRARLAAFDGLPAMEHMRPDRAARIGWKLAAAVLLGVGIGAGVMRWSAPDVAAHEQALFARDLIASHLRALAANSPVDVVSEDRHTVKPWFSGKIGESPPVVDPKSTDFPLLGGRIDYIGSRRAAVVVYGHRKHVIDVYVTPGGDGADGADARPEQSQGYTLTPCRLAGQSTWIVSDIDADSLRVFTGLLGCGR